MSNFSEDNKKKSTSGTNAKLLVRSAVEEKINSLKLNVKLLDNYVIGYKDMEQDQFKADFAIEFNEFNEKWLISTTSSPRSDRIQGDQFKAQHIRILDKRATRYYLVVPSSISDSDYRALTLYSTKINSRPCVRKRCGGYSRS